MFADPGSSRRGGRAGRPEVPRPRRRHGDVRAGRGPDLPRLRAPGVVRGPAALRFSGCRGERPAPGRAELRALTFLEVRYGAISAKMQTAGTLPGNLRVPSGYPPGTLYISPGPNLENPANLLVFQLVFLPTSSQNYYFKLVQFLKKIANVGKTLAFF